jgi:phospholipid-binding lipoprotein MlaA
VDAGALTTGTTNSMVFGVRTVNDTSFMIGDWEYLKSIALDPYEALRNAYLQKRVKKVAQ